MAAPCAPPLPRQAATAATKTTACCAQPRRRRPGTGRPGSGGVWSPLPTSTLSLYFSNKFESPRCSLLLHRLAFKQANLVWLVPRSLTKLAVLPRANAGDIRRAPARREPPRGRRRGAARVPRRGRREAQEAAQDRVGQILLTGARAKAWCLLIQAEASFLTGAGRTPGASFYTRTRLSHEGKGERLASPCTRGSVSLWQILLATS